MAEDDFGFQPWLIEGERDHNIFMENPMAEGRGVYRELAADRYQLKVPTFAGNEDVEQFIMEFSDVMEVTQWPPRVALLQLQMLMMDKAKPYGFGPDINSIFASLPCPFWHLRHRRPGPTAKTVAQSAHHTTGTCHHGDEAGADHVQRSASSEP